MMLLAHWLLVVLGEGHYQYLLCFDWTEICDKLSIFATFSRDQKDHFKFIDVKHYNINDL